MPGGQRRDGPRARRTSAALFGGDGPPLLEPFSERVLDVGRHEACERQAAKGRHQVGLDVRRTPEPGGRSHADPVPLDPRGQVLAHGRRRTSRRHGTQPELRAKLVHLVPSGRRGLRRHDSAMMRSIGIGPGHCATPALPVRVRVDAALSGRAPASFSRLSRRRRLRPRRTRARRPSLRSGTRRLVHERMPCCYRVATEPLYAGHRNRAPKGPICAQGMLVGRGRIELPQPKARVLQTLGLTTCPTDPRMVEMRGLEPLASAMRTRRSPS